MENPGLENSRTHEWQNQNLSGFAVINRGAERYYRVPQDFMNDSHGLIPNGTQTMQKK